MKEKRYCQYNNNCYETALNQDYIEYDWNTFPNLEAEFEVSYFIDGYEIEIDVCQGCKIDIENNCECEENYQWGSEKRIREPTKSYTGKRSGKNFSIQKPWTIQERNKALRRLHKIFKTHEGKKCSEECYN